jgi:hypothetical protein
MDRIEDFPVLVFALSFVVLWLSARTGGFICKKQQDGEEQEGKDFGVITSAILTLLALIIGFSFSMAVSRYDQRKNCEEAEANAIGTEYVRADLLPAAEGARVQALLKDYLDQRLLFYLTRDEHELLKINTDTGLVQTDLWSAVKALGAAQPTPGLALALSGMNDVLNSQGYTQAAWSNRIPREAWILVEVIAIFCNLMIGYGSRRDGAKGILFLVIPLVVAISLFLIADIDSPRHGIIRVRPVNLTSLSQSLHAR